jgi:hypothetical protein
MFIFNIGSQRVRLKKRMILLGYNINDKISHGMTELALDVCFRTKNLKIIVTLKGTKSSLGKQPVIYPTGRGLFSEYWGNPTRQWLQRVDRWLLST